MCLVRCLYGVLALMLFYTLLHQYLQALVPPAHLVARSVSRSVSRGVMRAAATNVLAALDDDVVE